MYLSIYILAFHYLELCLWTLSSFQIPTDTRDLQRVDEADRAEEGFYIRSGITIVLKNATIKDGTVIWKASFTITDQTSYMFETFCEQIW